MTKQDVDDDESVMEEEQLNTSATFAQRVA
jgi:hypothetical protein